jgi:copper chaperone NosL
MGTVNKNISRTSVVLLLLAAILLGISIFVPIWRIDLDAPQYPEGLRLLIYADNLGGNVDIINGLNHYIGMKTLHTEDFFEFTILPYLIGAFAALSLIAAFVRRKWLFYTLFTSFVLFGIVAMADFWKWEYNYGHNLDPNAAIIVPGMAYQPPLIGFKQLLNFGAYSVPALGGWLFVASGALMLLALFTETKLFTSKKMKLKGLALVLPAALLFSCSEAKPEKAKLNVDNCDNCKMTIADAKFVAELITSKGRIYKFDDLSCMQSYYKENPDKGGVKLFVANFKNPDQFLPVSEAFFVFGEQVGSPMGGNMAAFSSNTSAEEFSANRAAQILIWSDIQHQ